MMNMQSFTRLHKQEGLLIYSYCFFLGWLPNVLANSKVYLRDGSEIETISKICYFTCLQYTNTNLRIDPITPVV